MVGRWKTKIPHMRTADSAEAEFYLLEELSKPYACVTAGRIAIWVFLDGRSIREIVFAGHAESRTCASATSLFIEAAKKVGSDAEWFFTCGAGYFRVRPDRKACTPAELGYSAGLCSQSTPFAAPGLRLSRESLSRAGRHGEVQSALKEMVEEFSRLEQQTGLIRVIARDYRELSIFRERFVGHLQHSFPRIVLPDFCGPSIWADYLPIIPKGIDSSRALIFRLEGWDFDTPEFQAVADRHLRKVERELLRDAYRRLGVYRCWLREVTEKWVERLHWLSKDQVEEIRLSLPPPLDSPANQAHAVTVGCFLAEHLAGFLEDSQGWHLRLTAIHELTSFEAETERVDLDERIRPHRVRCYDFMSASMEEREGTEEDSFTWRERLKLSEPRLVSECLRHIHGMILRIKPYLDLRRVQRLGRTLRREDVDPAQQEAAIVADISQRIVVETMIRGWPSFYLDDEDDRAIFDKWAKSCRPRIWSLMARQAKRAGVDLQLLIEDNIVYDVRFNDDLGCTVQPLMLVDNSAHARIHGSHAGADCAVPMWPRHATKELRPEILDLASTNSRRAAVLVEQAREHAHKHNPDSLRAVRCLRLALACHPAEAGKLILREWARCLGRDTREEFDRARDIVTAAELCIKHRYREARRYLESYLNREPRPVADAYVMAALCELVTDEDLQVDQRKRKVRHDRLLDHFNALVERYNQTVSKMNPEVAPSPEEMFSLRERRSELDELKAELTVSKATIEEKEVIIEQGIIGRQQLIGDALSAPMSVASDHPALGRAAELAPLQLEEVAKRDCLYHPANWSEEMIRRYLPMSKIVRIHSIFETIHTLNMLDYSIGQDPERPKNADSERMEAVTRALWLPVGVEGSLMAIAKEFEKGKWDRIQVEAQIRGGLREVMKKCITEIQDLLGDREVEDFPLAETVATRIHIAQTIEGRYNEALQMLLNAEVGLGRATEHPWTILNYDVKDLPGGAELAFDRHNHTVSLVTGDNHVPLLRADLTTEEELNYVAEIFSYNDLPGRIRRFPPSLAEGILAIKVTPRREWHVWKDVMASLREELLFVLSFFSYDASLIPELAPPRTEKGNEMMRRMDSLCPRDTPEIDFTWQTLGSWERLLGPGVQRIEESHHPMSV